MVSEQKLILVREYLAAMTFLDLNKMFRCPTELHSEVLLCSIDQRSNIIRFFNQLLTEHDPESTTVRIFEVLNRKVIMDI